MGAPKYTAGKYAIGLCDICSFRYKLSELKSVYRRGMDTHLLACPKCHDKDHPQNFQGMYPVHDPQALRNPRSDSKERETSRELFGEGE